MSRYSQSKITLLPKSRTRTRAILHNPEAQTAALALPSVDFKETIFEFLLWHSRLRTHLSCGSHSISGPGTCICHGYWQEKGGEVGGGEKKESRKKERGRGERERRKERTKTILKLCTSDFLRCKMTGVTDLKDSPTQA